MRIVAQRRCVRSTPSLDGTSSTVSIEASWKSEVAMAVFLDHMIVPARDRSKSAELLATVLGVRWSEQGVGPFSPVYVNDGLTLDFDQWDQALPVQHYCFRMSEAEFPPTSE
jgi:hypothetical protein